MSFEIRPLTIEDIPRFRQAISAGFGHDLDPDDKQAAERFDALFARDRAFPVFDGDQLVGTGADYAFTVTVPGGAQVPMAGLTIITVRPTHTRRGVLTMMMREHFRRARERGELLAGLWASEAKIYGRFGYGPAARHHEVKFDARYTGRGGSEPGVIVRLVEKAEAEKLLPDMFALAQQQRPGMFQRSEEWWRYRHFYDPEKWREGASALRHAVAFQDEEPIGYVSYRQKEDWGQLPDGEIRVRELIPVTDAGYRALWHYVTSVDLFPIVKHWNMAPDDPLWLLLEDGRAVGTTAVSDALWVRLVDVPRALEARAYESDGSIVIRVTDGFCDWNEGTYRIEVDGGRATVARVAEDPEVSMTASTLGALYLGGRDAIAFARAGRIDGAAASVRDLNRMVRSSPQPWVPEIF
ncbi:MAG: GNAT family N-acetyltransferase [Acidimicrobiia bacterium]|jgi:predicted acetyltransferase